MQTQIQTGTDINEQRLERQDYLLKKRNFLKTTIEERIRNESSFALADLEFEFIAFDIEYIYTDIQNHCRTTSECTLKIELDKTNQELKQIAVLMGKS